ncbi:hypothetical protein ACTXT7_005173 [Hymenolepis weldensis]
MSEVTDLIPIDAHLRYNFAADMWLVGFIPGSAIFLRKYMFSGGTQRQILLGITHIVGSGHMLAALKKHGSDEFKGNKAFMNIKTKNLSTYLYKSNQRVAIESAVDLVSKLLVCNLMERCTAEQALKHSYFKRANRFPAEMEM